MLHPPTHTNQRDQETDKGGPEMSTNCWNCKTGEQIEEGWFLLQAMLEVSSWELLSLSLVVSSGTFSLKILGILFKDLKSCTQITIQQEIELKNKMKVQVKYLPKRTMSLNGIYSRAPDHLLELLFVGSGREELFARHSMWAVFYFYW